MCGMKTFWCVFMLVVLALPVSLAVQTTTIIDDWIPYEYSFSHGENKYSIRGANAQVEDEEVGFIIIKKNDESGIHVPWNSCETTDAYKYCYVDRSFDNNKIDIDPQGQVQPALRVLIENFKDEKGVSVSRSFSSTNLFYDQETEVSITVTNTGDVALNLSLLEPVPQGFEIKSYNKFTKGKANTLSTEFILFPGGTWNAKYVLRAISYVSESYQTTVTYIPTRESGEEQTMQSSATTLSVQAPFALTEAIGSTSLDIRDEQSYTITIKNTEDEDIVVNEITLKYPPELQQILFDDVSQKQGFIASATADTLKPNESITYNIRG